MLLKLIFCLSSFLFSLSLIGDQIPVYSGQSVSAPHISAGNNLAKSGNYSQALTELNQAIAKDPNNARAYKLRGNVYYAMGDYVQSLRDLDQVVNLVPDSVNAYCDRAIAHSMVGNHGLALTDIEYALKLKPTSSFAQAVRAKILEKASDNS